MYLNEILSKLQMFKVRNFIKELRTVNDLFPLDVVSLFSVFLSWIMLTGLMFSNYLLDYVNKYVHFVNLTNKDET